MRKNTLHLKAPGNWLNDPNGFIYYQGKYHLFYQHFPYAPVWGTMHWGHAVSEDLIHWEHLDIAVFPTKKYDEDGAFSGSALEKDGKLYLFYSAVSYVEREEENIHRVKNDNYETSQAMIVSADGFQFDNWTDKRLLIPVVRDEKIADITHTKDPKVWKEGDSYYMILGSTYRREVGRVVFFRSQDAVKWEYVSQYRNPAYGKIIECPDVFPVGDSHVFIGSAMYLTEDGKEYQDQAVCTTAEFRTEGCELHLPDTYQYVDYGLDLYAPHVNLDRNGRRVMMAWMRMPKAVEEPGGKPWNGMMCQPRVVEVQNGHVYFRVHPEVESYFCREAGGTEEINFQKPWRMKVRLQKGDELDIGGYRIRVEDDRIRTDRSRVFAGLEGYRLTGATPRLGGRYALDIFVEPNLIEIFVNGGQYVLSHVVYGLKEGIEGKSGRIFLPQ